MIGCSFCCHAFSPSLVQICWVRYSQRWYECWMWSGKSGDYKSVPVLVAWGEGAVTSWLVRSSGDREVLVQALAGKIVLYSWAKHLTHTVTRPPSTQVYKLVPANWMLGGGGGNPAIDYHPIQGEVEILPCASCFWNQDKLRPDGALMQTLPTFTSCSLDCVILSVVQILFW